MKKICASCNTRDVTNPHWNATKCEACKARPIKSCYVCGIEITNTVKHKYCSDCKETLNPRPVKSCQECGKDITKTHKQKYCQECGVTSHKKYGSGKQRASMSIVNIAVKSGILDKLDGSINCVDCGNPATEYEHRDYMKPLDVDPVCHKCNIKRGPALNHFTEMPSLLNIKLELPEEIK